MLASRKREHPQPLPPHTHTDSGFQKTHSHGLSTNTEKCSSCPPSFFPPSRSPSLSPPAHSELEVSFVPYPPAELISIFLSLIPKVLQSSVGIPIYYIILQPTPIGLEKRIIAILSNLSVGKCFFI